MTDVIETDVIEVIYRILSDELNIDNKKKLEDTLDKILKDLNKLENTESEELKTTLIN